MIRLSLLPHPVIFLANNLVLRRLCSWSCYVSDKDRMRQTPSDYEYEYEYEYE